MKVFARMLSIALSLTAFSIPAAFLLPGALSQSKPDQRMEELRAKAEQGDAQAQNSLGFRYEYGKGVAEDKPEARRWFRLAAEHGNASGKANLCRSYADALKISDKSDNNLTAPIRALNGSKGDVLEAIRWCDASANVGAVLSIYNLGVLYAKGGPGVKPNYEEAYFWLWMNTLGKDVLCVKVGKKLTPERRAEIEQRAKAWQPKP